jgi:hypothetical protein
MQKSAIWKERMNEIKWYIDYDSFFLYIILMSKICYHIGQCKFKKKRMMNGVDLIFKL